LATTSSCANNQKLLVNSSGLSSIGPVEYDNPVQMKNETGLTAGVDGWRPRKLQNIQRKVLKGAS
jgi:hypothetical protein